jgi:hypothetical protein
MAMLVFDEMAALREWLVTTYFVLLLEFFAKMRSVTHTITSICNIAIVS